MKVVGFRKVDFRAENGSQISGTRLYCTFEDEKVSGVGTEAFFVSDAKLDFVPAVGDEIQVIYNKYGKVDRVVYA